MTDQSAIITHHEAGHAVAALMTVDNQLDERMTVTVGLVGGLGTGNCDVRISVDHPVQAAFTFYAGPWAEARVQWGRPVLSLDDTGEDGAPFRRLVAETFVFDADSDGARYAYLAQAIPGIPDNEPQWSAELEHAWPVIERLADVLRQRLKYAEPQIDPISSALGGRRLMQIASMTNGEVVEFVGPLLQSRGLWRYIR